MMCYFIFGCNISRQPGEDSKILFFHLNMCSIFDLEIYFKVIGIIRIYSENITLKIIQH
jgi:hypothetical protein